MKDKIVTVLVNLGLVLFIAWFCGGAYWVNQWVKG